jgi:putative PIN family toxin of toxin-antitoxin system
VRVVIDTNVFVSAAIRTGPSHRVVQAWLQRNAFEVVVSHILMAEVREVLTTRPRLRRWIDLATAIDYLTTIETLADIVADPATIPATTRDVDDDYLVAIARHYDADYIVSGDKDLLAWPDQQPPAISPADFEEIIST